MSLNFLRPSNGLNMDVVGRKVVTRNKGLGLGRPGCSVGIQTDSVFDSASTRRLVDRAQRWLRTVLYSSAIARSRALRLLLVGVHADPPGQAGDGSLVNDLDLVVTATPLAGPLPTAPYSLAEALAVSSDIL